MNTLSSEQFNTYASQGYNRIPVAREILAEVFAIRLSDVDEMLRLRSEDQEMWPERFGIV